LNANQINVTHNATVLFAGYIAGNVNVAPNTTFQLYEGSNATLNGNLVNNGTLVLTGDHPLHVYGTVDLGSNGFVEASLTDDKEAPLIVTGGNLALAGELGYNLVKKPLLKSEKFLLAQLNSVHSNITNSTIVYLVTGTFNGTAYALKGSEIDRDLNIEYNSGSVLILYGFKVADVDAWMWVVFSIIVVVLIAAVIAVFIKCRSRHNYQPVP